MRAELFHADRGTDGHVEVNRRLFATLRTRLKTIAYKIKFAVMKHTVQYIKYDTHVQLCSSVGRIISSMCGLILLSYRVCVQMDWVPVLCCVLCTVM